MAQSDQDIENLRMLLEQHWNHCRHLESERSWFISAYAAVIGGVTALLIQSGVENFQKLEITPTFKFIVAFLIGFTLLGFFHTVRWTYALECHRQRVNTLIGLMKPGTKPELCWKGLNMDIPTMELSLTREGSKIREGFRTRYWFPVLYFVTLILFAILFSGFLRWLAIGCLAVALWLGTGYLRSKPG